MKRIKFWDIFENRIVYHSSGHGFEMFLIKNDKQPEEYRLPNRLNKENARDRGYDYSKEDIKQYNLELRAGIKEFKFYIKGLRILLKNHSIPGAMEQMASAYMGKDIDLIQRFKNIIYSTCNETIVKIGQGMKYCILDYVDGSFEVYIKE